MHTDITHQVEHTSLISLSLSHGFDNQGSHLIIIKHHISCIYIIQSSLQGERPSAANKGKSSLTFLIPVPILAITFSV